MKKNHSSQVLDHVGDLIPIFGLYCHISRVDDDDKVDYSNHVLMCVSPSKLKLEEYAKVLNSAESIKRRIQPRNLMRDFYYVESVVCI